MAIRIRQTQMQPQKWVCGKVSQKAEGSSGVYAGRTSIPLRYSEGPSRCGAPDLLSGLGYHLARGPDLGREYLQHLKV